mgnify:CR=1 FL=1
MSTSQPYKSVKVDLVVQDYMDSLLADLFPEVEAESVSEKTEAELQVTPELEAEPKALPEPEPEPQSIAAIQDTNPPSVSEISVQPERTEQTELVATPALSEPVSAPIKEVAPSFVGEEATPIQGNEVEPQVEVSVNSPQELEALPYPNAPPWAQQEFDVLLFDVCGLKLAVSMEALGRIIKVEHELNQLIGRPGWFMGAYTEPEQSLYVVDTAKFIMPEKGFDLNEVGFEYIIQLQRSHWTLACKEVYSTVRISPDQVKWRSTQGKRPWLAGTVIEHMCALIHVDSLVALLESENA